jgi:hypothetical protein
VPQASTLLAFSGILKGHLPGVLLGASGDLLGASGGVFLEVGSGLAAEVHHALRLGQFA